MSAPNHTKVRQRCKHTNTREGAWTGPRGWSQSPGWHSFAESHIEFISALSFWVFKADVSIGLTFFTCSLPETSLLVGAVWCFQAIADALKRMDCGVKLIFECVMSFGVWRCFFWNLREDNQVCYVNKNFAFGFWWAMKVPNVCFLLFKFSKNLGGSSSIHTFGHWPTHVMNYL